MRSRVGVAVLLMATMVALGACGGGDDGGSRTLNFFIFNEPGGGPQDVAEKCSNDSDGRYRIEFTYLPSDADQQREQLVRRLGAEDASIDIIGMDIIWTGEFANAEWIVPVPEEIRDDVTENVFDSVLATAQFEDRLYNVPAWSNTQLLWYRTDEVDEPPRTWGEMVDIAEERDSKIEVQGNRYEGLVVWTNAMIESAGARILSDIDEVSLEEEPTIRALEAMGNMAQSDAAVAGIDTSDEDSARLGFESGDAIFQINYPFVYASAEEGAPEVHENMGAARYPGVTRDDESAPPLGGINLGVSAFSDQQDLAWDAIRCMVRPENQLTILEAGGLPPVREDLYDQDEVKEAYPGFGDVIRESIESAAPRPSESPAYQDLSLGIQRAMHPSTKISPRDAQETYDRLREYVEQAIERRGLL
jgi:multiple sugar transport system substrate-binding protein